MSAITIRKLPEDVKQRLRMRAAAHGTSMEAEARTILIAGLAAPISSDMTWIEQLIALGRDSGGIDLVVPPDVPAVPADFGDR
ncbi:FitA-like ribbon-helix-helix domain-containing protein [Nostocoides australiense]